MAGWEFTAGHVFAQVIQDEPQDGVAGNALNSKWTMSYGNTETDAPTLTTTPADIDYANATSVETNELLGAPNRFPHVKYTNFPAPSTASKMRFSGNVENVAADADTTFTVEDARLVHVDNAQGYIRFDRTNTLILFFWEGASVSVPFVGWHSPGVDVFRAGMEFSGGSVSGYYYAIPGAGDGLTNEQRNNTKLVKIGTLPWTRVQGPQLYPGCHLGFNPAFMGGIWIEYDPASAGGVGPGELPPFPFNPYGLYKSQLTLHGLLNDAKTGSG